MTSLHIMFTEKSSQTWNSRISERSGIESNPQSDDGVYALNVIVAGITCISALVALCTYDWW